MVFFRHVTIIGKTSHLPVMHINIDICKYFEYYYEANEKGCLFSVPRDEK